MSSTRAPSLAIPLGALYRYAVGFKYRRRKGMTIGGGLTWLYEGNLPLEDAAGAGGDINGKYGNVCLYIF